MARPLRIEYPGAYYHVVNRGQSRRNIFIKDKGRQTFLDLLADMARLWKVEIYAYCLMENHYHLLLSTPTGALSRPMRHLDGIYTQKFNRVHHRDGPLFRGRYKAILIEMKRRKRGRENEARMVAIYLGRQLGGHRHEEIGKTVGLGKASSVSSAYLLMRERVATEKQLQQRVRKIEEALTKSKKRT
jgi:REP element-mobilizing transposase RayT